MTYAGPNALARAELAVEVLKKMSKFGTNCPIRFDILGTVSVHSGDKGSSYNSFKADGDYRVHIASKVKDKKMVERINQEMSASTAVALREEEDFGNN